MKCDLAHGALGCLTGLLFMYVEEVTEDNTINNKSALNGHDISIYTIYYISR